MHAKSCTRERTGGLGVLAPGTEAPEVTETTVRTNLLEALQVVTELRVDGVRENLAVLAIDDVPLPVQEPCGNLELCWVLDDGDETLKLVRVELTSTAKALSVSENFAGRNPGLRTAC